MSIYNRLMEYGTLGMQIESPKDWKPPEPPNDWKPPEVIKPSVSSSKIPAEAYVKTIPREAFYKEELYKRICCVNVTECS